MTKRFGKPQLDDRLETFPVTAQRSRSGPLAAFLLTAVAIKPLVDLLWSVDLRFLTISVNIPAVYAVVMISLAALFVLAGCGLFSTILPLCALATASCIGNLNRGGAEEVVRLWSLLGVAVVTYRVVDRPSRLARLLGIYLTCLLPLLALLVLQAVGVIPGQYFDYIAGQVRVRPSGGLPH